MSAIEIRVDPFPAEQEFSSLWHSAWGAPWTGDLGAVLAHSLAHLCAYDDDRLVGYVNLAWDGGSHAFLLDPAVHPDWQRRGIGRTLITRAIALAGERGAHWLHVDYEERLTDFYRACGFRPTAAGLIDLKG